MISAIPLYAPIGKDNLNLQPGCFTRIFSTIWGMSFLICTPEFRKYGKIVISDASLANDAEMTVDIDQIDSGGVSAGLKVTLIGYQTP